MSKHTPGPEPEPVAWMAEEWQQRVEQMRAEAMAYKEAYFRLVEMIAKSKAMEPGCPVFLATPPARRPLTPAQEAAPELLEALQDLCDTLGECGMTEKARAAITKATGGNDE